MERPAMRIDAPDNPYNFEDCEECSKAINCQEILQFNHMNDSVITQRGRKATCIYCGQLQLTGGQSMDKEQIPHTKRCTAHGILHLEKITDIKIKWEKGFSVG